MNLGMFDNEKILFLESVPESDAVILIWVKLMVLAGKSNMNGYIMLTESIPYTEETLVNRLKKPAATVQMALELFERLGMLCVENGAFLLPNWGKYQSQDKLEQIRESNNKRKREERKRKKLALQPASDVSRDSHDICHSDVTACHATDIEEELEEDIDTTTHRNDEESRFLQMAQYFYSKVMERAEANKVAHLIRTPNFTKWADEFRKIVMLDKRDLQEIKAIIDWSTSDPFWSKNILSPKKLRDKYTDLGIKMHAASSQQNKSGKNEKNKGLLKQKMEEAQREQGSDIGTTSGNIFSLS